MPRKGPSPYKGVPRKDWPALTAKLKAEKTATTQQAPTPLAEQVLREIPQAEQFLKQVHSPRKGPDKNFTMGSGGSGGGGGGMTASGGGGGSNVSLDVPIVQPSERQYKPNLFSGKIQKLVLMGADDGRTYEDRLKDPIPGYRTHWFVDKENSGVRLQQAKASGWEFITRNEVELNDGITPGNNDLGSHVRQIAGVENNSPFYMYAMKKPLWMEQEHQAEYAQRAIAPIKDALVKGKLPGARPEDRQYAAGDPIALTTRSGLPPISIGTKTYR